jgi:hypothetical protein
MLFAVSSADDPQLGTLPDRNNHGGFDSTLATQSIVGMVNIGSAPAAREFAKNVSPLSPAVALLSRMLSKYQSLPRLSAFACRL